MGIFDDAIREHLELKRHAGADEDELKELEDEAFGPPARPGEPDFPGTSEEAAVEAGPEQPVSVFDAETAESQTPADAVIEESPEDQPALTPIEEGAIPGADAPSDPQPDPVPEAEQAASEEATEEPAQEEPVRSEEPAPEPAEASSFTTEEREAIADQPTVFFEQQAPAELELGELELDIDEEIEEVGGSVSEPLSEDDQLTVEDSLAEPAAETEVAEPPHQAEPEPAPADPELDPEAPLETPEGAEPGTSDDDVLEETPEFLRDNPDDDELWFEQGEPKDFDF